jgi:pimeloyl-ACP methyl ester carboxylesterase
MRVVLSALLLFAVALSGAQATSWGPCPFAAPVPTECANVTAPLNWLNNDTSAVVQLFASRITSTASGPAKGTVWFLNGGTGVGGACGPGSAWTNYYASLGFHVALPDFRGTGMSQPKFFCSDDPHGYNTPSMGCAAQFTNDYGPSGMYDFSITMGAYDLHMMIETLGGAMPQFVQGDSFGTFWGQRYLTIFPEQATAVVMESFGVPKTWTYFEAPDNLAWAARRTLQYCAEDPACDAMAGGGADPYAVLEEIMREAEEGTWACAAKLDSRVFGVDPRWAISSMVGYFVGSGNRNNYAFLPAFTYRLARCNDDDVVMIYRLYQNMFNQTSAGSAPAFLTRPAAAHDVAAPPIPADACDISEPILYSLFLSEGAPRRQPLPLPAMMAHLRRIIGAAPVELMAHARRLYDAWPRYQPDQYFGVPTNRTGPLLFVNGDLDISTPWDNAGYSTRLYNQSNMHFVKLPTCPHVGFLQSPVASSPVPCGMQIILSFFQSNGTSFDSSCTSQIIPLDFAGTDNSTAALRKALWGVEDIWAYDGPANFRVQ